MREFLICYEEDTDKFDTLTIYAESARAALKAVRKYDVGAEDIRAISDLGEVGAQESDEACITVRCDRVERWSRANEAIATLSQMCQHLRDNHKCSERGCPIFVLCCKHFNLVPQNWTTDLLEEVEDDQ